MALDAPKTNIILVGNFRILVMTRYDYLARGSLREVNPFKLINISSGEEGSSALSKLPPRLGTGEAQVLNLPDSSPQGFIQCDLSQVVNLILLTSD